MTMTRWRHKNSLMDDLEAAFASNVNRVNPERVPAGNGLQATSRPSKAEQIRRGQCCVALCSDLVQRSCIIHMSPLGNLHGVSERSMRIEMSHHEQGCRFEEPGFRLLSKIDRNSPFAGKAADSPKQTICEQADRRA